ncbi:MAG TPA: cytochrome o ubiquinol oxidase subunit IV [Candidatus Saccharimonadales bacterium]|nr:cytochrome o ubiquinol oxidase subunit IV [Candidatus Saccharimonadales bacterium]
MKTSQKVRVSNHHESLATRRSYTTGFVLSIVLTLIAYVAVVNRQFSRLTLIYGLISLAVIQFLVQLFYFLHIGHEPRPRWKRLLLVLMIGVVLLVVLGSIWIMYNLNYRMTPSQVRQYLHSQDGGV